MTEKELRKWLANEKAEDRWSIAINGQTIEGFYKLEDVFELPEAEIGAKVQLLHRSMIDVKEPPWVLLELSSVLSSEQRERFRNRRKAESGPMSKQLVVQLLIVLVVLGGVLAYVFWPEEQESEIAPVDPMDNVISKLEAVRLERKGKDDNDMSKPSLKISVGTSGRIIFISNLSDENWESCEAVINDEFHFKWNESIAPGRTIHAPLRTFSNGDKEFDIDDATPEKVTVTVPGFRVWEDRFR